MKIELYTERNNNHRSGIRTNMVPLLYNVVMLLTDSYQSKRVSLCQFSIAIMTYNGNIFHKLTSRKAAQNKTD